MAHIIWSGVGVVCTGLIVALERKRMAAQACQQEQLLQPVSRHELEEDARFDMLVPPIGFVQLDPFLRELQDAITTADDARVRGLLAGMGARHPDSMKLDRGLTPLLLTAYMRVRSEEHDRRLRGIMQTLLHRGALITQREGFSGVTIMHLLAVQPTHNHVMHRMRFLLNILEKYRNGPRCTYALPGLVFDPVLNDAPQDGGGGAEDTPGMTVHLLGMRCYQNTLPEDLTPAAARRNFLQHQRRMLPLGLQDTGRNENGESSADAELN